MIIEENGALSHHGVKGMKWGKRKPRDEAARAKQFGPKKAGKPQPRVSADGKKAAELRGRPANTLTNKQLKNLNERIQLEQNYNRLIQEPTTIDKIEKGNQQVKKMLGVGTTAVSAYKLATNPATREMVQKGATWLARMRNPAIAALGPG